MDRKRNAAVTACFLAAILLILTVADLVDGDAEHFAAYRNWAELKTRMTVLLQRQEVNGVYLCEDDYLIRVFKPEAVDSAVVEEKMKLLEELVERYDAKVMLVPNADQVLRDKLPWQAQCYDQSELLELVKERIGEEALIDVYDALQAHAQETIYYRTDPHWTTLGAYYGYQEWKTVTDSASWKLLDPAALVPVADDFTGPLQERLGMDYGTEEIQVFPRTLSWQPEVMYDYQVVTDSFYAQEHLHTEQALDYFLDGAHAFVSVDTGIRGRGDLVLIGNSWANSMVPMLAGHYSHIYMVNPECYGGVLDTLIGSFMDAGAQMLVLYDCIGFLEGFRYQ